RGQPCRRRAFRTDRAERHRMHRRRPGDQRGRACRPLSDALRPAPQRQPGTRARLRGRRGAEARAPGEWRPHAAAPRRRLVRRAANGRALPGALTPGDARLAAQTDSYFLKTKAIVARFGDRSATYALFLRRPVISAPRFAVAFLEAAAVARGTR